MGQSARTKHIMASRVFAQVIGAALVSSQSPRVPWGAREILRHEIGGESQFRRGRVSSSPPKIRTLATEWFVVVVIS